MARYSSYPNRLEGKGTGSETVLTLEKLYQQVETAPDALAMAYGLRDLANLAGPHAGARNRLLLEASQHLALNDLQGLVRVAQGLEAKGFLDTSGQPSDRAEMLWVLLRAITTQAVSPKELSRLSRFLTHRFPDTPAGQPSPYAGLLRSVLIRAQEAPMRRITEDMAPDSPEEAQAQILSFSQSLQAIFGKIPAMKAYGEDQVVAPLLCGMAEHATSLEHLHAMAKGLSRLVEKTSNLPTLLQSMGAPADPPPQLLAQLPAVYDTLRPYLTPPQVHPDFLHAMLQEIISLPDHWKETAQALTELMFVPRDLQWLEPSATPEAHAEKLTLFKKNMGVLSALKFPHRLLNQAALNQEHLQMMTLWGLYYFTEHTEHKEIAQELLPELLAMLGLFSEKAREYQEVHTDDSSDQSLARLLEQATEGITRLKGFIVSDDRIGRIDRLSGIVYNNWSRVGTLGLSFSKWQYDAMQRWKSGGPMRQPALLQASGMFTPIPSRENDSAYFGGFFHYNPDTQLSVEMRRAYMVLSKPDLGTLVIRNSSPTFGRYLLEEPAYYHPTQTFSEPPHLFNPDQDLEEAGFISVIGKELNRESVQERHHIKVERLLNEFDALSEQYTAWKCGFQNGTPPPGFSTLLEASLKSAENQGQSTPFGKHKNIKLAWINPYGLPMAVQSFDVAHPSHQQELGKLLQVLAKRQTFVSPQAYQDQLPNLMRFLQTGLEQNLELILTE
jgi:hypothetical protein